MSRPVARDFFDKARARVSAGLFIAGAVAIVGSLLDWVVFKLDPSALPNQDASLPISGLDVGGDGAVALGAGIALIVCAFLLVLRRRALYSGLALLASVVIGAIGISDYRGVADLAPNVRVGEARPGIGLTLVVFAAILGLIASVAGIAATPRTDSP
jgi:hypothetical protein